MKVRVAAAVLLLFVLFAPPVVAQINLRASVPLVVNSVGTGSAYWVAPNTLRTVAHIAGYPPVYVNGIQATVLCIDQDTDSALIRAGDGPALLEGRVTLQLRDEVLLVGWPTGQYVEALGTVHGYAINFPYANGQWVGPIYILKTGRTEWRGSSGGVVLKNGLAVATITGGMADLVSAVPISDSKCQVI